MKGNESVNNITESSLKPKSIKTWTEYSEDEKKRLKASILEKRTIGASLTEEETEYQNADAEYFRPEDNPRNFH